MRERETAELEIKSKEKLLKLWGEKSRAEEKGWWLSERKGTTEESFRPKEQRKKQRKGHGCKRKQRKKASAK